MHATKKTIGRSMLALSLALVALPVTGLAQSAETHFASGRALLAKGDFQGAMASFAAAARADQTNRDYLNHFALVRRVLLVRAQLERETDPQQWEQLARSLHAFYVSNGVYGEALELNKQLHRRVGTAESARMLAETQLAMNLPAEAVEVLASLPAEQATPQTQALLGIALARTERPEAAAKIAAAMPAADDLGPGALYSFARLNALLGNRETAAALLVQAFERIAPSRLDGFKQHAAACDDFAPLKDTPAFAAAMRTASKVPESACSGGTTCAGCPMRGQCSKN